MLAPLLSAIWTPIIASDATSAPVRNTRSRMVIVSVVPVGVPHRPGTGWGI